MSGIKNILPHEYSPITSYPFFATITSIYIQYIEGKHWFCENFVQLRVAKITSTEGEIYFMFPSLNFLAEFKNTTII